jgi:hypothetical protein
MHGQIVVKTKELTLLRRVKTLSYPAHGIARLLILHSAVRRAGLYTDDFEYAEGIERACTAERIGPGAPGGTGR